MGRSWKERVAEYVDSERMRQRVKVGDQISCLIDGNYGTYLTRASLKRRSESSCSCPSEDYPCKHAAALVRTYRINPRSFLDFEKVISEKKLDKMERPELLQLIREMVLASPTSLSAMGVEGFEKEDEEEYD